MTEPVCRPATPADLPALKALWQVCFGDAGETVDAFLAHAEGATPFAAERAGGIVCALWALPCAHNGAPAAYLYAVGTLPAHRGRGLAMSLLSYAMRTLEGEGIGRFWLYPADPALTALYRPLGFEAAPPSRRLTLPASPGEVALRPLAAEEAAARRAALLQGRSAVEWDAASLARAAALEGGTWYGVGGGLALLCPEGSTLRAPEWLGSDPAQAAAVAASLGLAAAEVTCPAWLGAGESLPPPLARGFSPAYSGLLLQ